MRPSTRTIRACRIWNNPSERTNGRSCPPVCSFFAVQNPSPMPVTASCPSFSITFWKFGGQAYVREQIYSGHSVWIPWTANNAKGTNEETQTIQTFVVIIAMNTPFSISPHFPRNRFKATRDTPFEFHEPRTTRTARKRASSSFTALGSTLEWRENLLLGLFLEPLSIYKGHSLLVRSKVSGDTPYLFAVFASFAVVIFWNFRNIILKTIYCRFWLTAGGKISKRSFSGGQGWEGSLPVRISH